jgi:hypothetical protein
MEKYTDFIFKGFELTTKNLGAAVAKKFAVYNIHNVVITNYSY